jgi:HK97 family phage prohead protease
MSKAERRRLSFPGQLRSEQRDDGTVRVAGYAAVFDSESHGEVVRRSAFNRTLAQRDDVRLLVNHDGVPLARTKSGTLVLTVDDTGLRMVADLDPSNPTVSELVSALERGDIDQMSFAFSEVGTPHFSDDGLRELREVILYDVSVVTYPWYQATSVELNQAPQMAEVRDALSALVAADRLADVAAALAALTAPEDPETAPPVVSPPARRELARLWFPAA